LVVEGDLAVEPERAGGQLRDGRRDVGKAARVVAPVAAYQADALAFLVGDVRQPSTFSSLTQPSRWNGSRTSLGPWASSGGALADSIGPSISAARSLLRPGGHGYTAQGWVVGFTRFTLHGVAEARPRGQSHSVVGVDMPGHLLEGLRVLVVSHQPDLVTMFAAMVGVCGGVAWSARSARDAVSALDERPHVVLVDAALRDEGLTLPPSAASADVPVVAFACSDEDPRILPAAFRAFNIGLLRSTDLDEVCTTLRDAVRRFAVGEVETQYGSACSSPRGAFLPGRPRTPLDFGESGAPPSSDHDR
jgi:hypothetical protein